MGENNKNDKKENHYVTSALSGEGDAPVKGGSLEVTGSVLIFFSSFLTELDAT